jgi:hypothetical protein
VVVMQNCTHQEARRFLLPIASLNIGFSLVTINSLGWGLNAYLKPRLNINRIRCNVSQRTESLT